MPRRKDNVLRRGRIAVEQGDKVYAAGYEVLKGGAMRLETGQATQLGGMTEEQVARMLLREIIKSGVADREGLGRPKAEK